VEAEVASKVLDALTGKFAGAILGTSTAYGDDVAVIKREGLLDIARFLRDDPAMAFNLPCYCTCIDYLGMELLTVSPTTPLAVPAIPAVLPEETPRFAMVYELRSLSHRHRIRLKVPLQENDLKVPTLSGLWIAFNWMERETYDMYGVAFEGHPDLRRILMYDEFIGYPLRKDYPKERRQPLVRREWSDE
jgi:NADH-quinone oxidoreductase subunit C